MRNRSTIPAAKEFVDFYLLNKTSSFFNLQKFSANPFHMLFSVFAPY